MDSFAKVSAYSQEKLTDERTGHDFEHAKRVLAWVEKIIQEDGFVVDEFVAKSAALLHDTIDDKVVADVTSAREELLIFLGQIATETQADQIIAILDNMSYSANLQEKKSLSIEGQIVQDADRIDALGAQGILRTAYFGGSNGHPIFDKHLLPRTYSSKSDYRKGSTVINHFYEKLFLLPDLMNTPTGKKEGIRRKVFMESFLTEFFNEMAL